MTKLRPMLAVTDLQRTIRFWCAQHGFVGGAFGEPGDATLAVRNRGGSLLSPFAPSVSAKTPIHLPRQGGEGCVEAA